MQIYTFSFKLDVHQGNTGVVIKQNIGLWNLESILERVFPNVQHVQKASINHSSSQLNAYLVLNISLHHMTVQCLPMIA